jgi:hypothetical protein
MARHPAAGHDRPKGGCNTANAISDRYRPNARALFLHVLPGRNDNALNIVSNTDKKSDEIPAELSKWLVE